MLIVIMVLVAIYAAWYYWLRPARARRTDDRIDDGADAACGLPPLPRPSDVHPSSHPSSHPSPTTSADAPPPPSPASRSPVEVVGGFSTMSSDELPKLGESEAFGLAPNPKDKFDIEKIEEKRKFINCKDEPKSFLPPKKLTNSYDHDDDEGTYVYDRCHMDTKAHIPKRDKSRSVYQSIAGDLDFPMEDRGVVSTRVVSTIHENDGGYFNRRGACIEESPPHPA